MNNEIFKDCVNETKLMNDILYMTAHNVAIKNRETFDSASKIK